MTARVREGDGGSVPFRPDPPPAGRRFHRRVASGYHFLTTASGRRIGDAAAESAFFLAVAILPMMLTTSAVLRAIRPLLGRDAEPGVRYGLAGLLRIVLSPRGGTAAEAAQRLLTETTGGLLTLGSIASVLLLTRAMRSILTGLDAINLPVAAGTGRHALRRWGLALWFAVLLVLLAAVLLAMAAIGPLLGHSEQVSVDVAGPVRVIWVWLRWPVGLAGIFGYVLLVHRMAADRVGDHPRRDRRRPALAGAAASTVGVVAASLLLPLYVRIASNVSPTLGVLGGGLILLIWAYLLVFFLLFGAQV